MSDINELNEVSVDARQPRRSILIMLLLAIGGTTSVLGSLAAAALRYVVGPTLSPDQKTALTARQRAHLKSQLDLAQLKLDRVNNSRILLSKLSDLPDDGGVMFTDYALQPALLFKTGDRSCIARSAVCTHLGCTVQTTLVDGKIFCPCHQSYFDLASGNPLKGPATIALAEEPIVIDGDAVYLVKPRSPIKIGPGQTEIPIL